MMAAKIFLQDIWVSGADWDDPLPPTLVRILEVLGERAQIHCITQDSSLLPII
jgi:hypothetical protein